MKDPQSGSTNVKTWRIFAFPAVLALIGYVLLYSCDARMRVRNGPWEVEFFQETNGTPALIIQHPGLGIQNVTVRFIGERAPTNMPALPSRVRFDEPSKAVPFGKTAFDDLMYLPGTVVLHCFGHEVQMLPGKLYLNRNGIEWADGARFNLEPAAKLPTLDPPPKLRKTR